MAYNTRNHSCGISVGSENSDGDSIFWTAPTTLDDYVGRAPFQAQTQAVTSASPVAAPPAPAPFVAHRGSLRRVHQVSSEGPAPPLALSRQHSSASTSVSEGGQSSSSGAVSTSSAPFIYAISIAVPRGGTYELKFERHEYDVLVRLFSILDSESRGSVGRNPIREFVRLRCPVFRRRDKALRSNGLGDGTVGNGGDVKDIESAGASQTFDEVWESVVECSASPPSPPPDATVELGLEGWMVFCRLVALAQYQEAKRRFSARHSQQTMRHKSGGRGSEVVLVSVPPPDPPEPLTARELAEHGAASPTPLSLPELDLDHCLVSAHDVDSSGAGLGPSERACVEIKVFGPGRSAPPLLGSVATSASGKGGAANLEFVVTFYPSGISSSSSSIIVRRTFADMEWLRDTFALHKSAGGTLCGRILPPFPSRGGGGGASSDGAGAQSSVTGSVVAAGGSAAMAAASAGAGMIASVAKSAKSFWGGYVAYGSSVESSSAASHAATDVSASGGSGGRGGSKLGKLAAGIQRASGLGRGRGGEKEFDTSSSKARQVERYLNYLLEHPALSTSFPLNVMLKASQSGLESAKRMLDEHAKSHDRRRKQQQEIMQMDQEKSSAFLSPSLLSLIHAGGTTPGQQPNLSWVRSAAQAAMALQLHGILETTGMPSASAKLQHASLPNFSGGNKSWGEEDGGDVGQPPARGVSHGTTDVGEGGDVDEGAECFESGVVNVESGLEKDGDGAGHGEGYDMLPSPVPLPKRSVLCAGSVGENDSGVNSEINVMAGSQQDREQAISKGYHYGSRTHQRGNLTVNSSDDSAAILGDMAVDNDIDKLREIIGSVDNVLSRCLAAGVVIGEARRKEDALHLNIVRGLDSWEGLRGEIVSQRALLNGVTILEGGSDVSEESYATLNDALSWQTSLATSAVSAAEDVRSAVRASRTAARAKLAAEAAAKTAAKACDAGKFATADDARAAQTRASIAHSHAIHSAVIEHEALAAKRRAAMALAHDVKCWNVHRKRELLRTCREVARQQQKASHQSTAAWAQLRDGLVGAAVVPVTDERRQDPISDNVHEHYVGHYEDPSQPTSFSMHSSIDTFGAEAPSAPTERVSLDHSVPGSSSEEVSSPILAHLGTDMANESMPNADHESLPFAEASEDPTDTGTFPFANNERVSEKPEERFDTKDDAEDNDMMTSSMQSLVDGLMNWGGQYDSQEDLSLPSGMAVSIALEESVLSHNHGLSPKGF